MTPHDDLVIGTYEDDEDLLSLVGETGSSAVRISRPDDVRVVLGRGSKQDVELNVAACVEDGVRVERRRGGGCSVVLDEGNLIVSVVLPVEGLGGIQRHFDWISDWLATELAQLGIDGVEQRGTSDLAIDDKKIGGSCIFRRKDLLYYSTTLLVTAELDRLERYLAHPPREPDYRAGRSHREFVANLSTLRGVHSAADLAEKLEERLTPESLKRHRDLWDRRSETPG